MDIDAKLRPLYILQLLKERTDEDNYLTTNQLCDILKQKYGMDTHRTTIKSNIEVLRKAGFSIDERISSQNQYRFFEREFDVAELKTIIDAKLVYGFDHVYRNPDGPARVGNSSCYYLTDPPRGVS